MRTALRNIRKITLEEWVFFILSPMTCLAALWVTDFDLSYHFKFQGMFDKTTIEIGLFFAVIFLYYGIISIYVAYDSNSKTLLETAAYKLSNAWENGLIKNAVCAVLSIALVSLFISIITNALYVSSTKSQVIATSRSLMQIDYTLFGSYVPFYLQSILPSYFAPILVAIYQSVISIIGILFIFFFLVDTKYFRKVLLSSALVFLISIPVWLMIPAISPEEMFRANIFDLALSELNFTDISLHKSLENYLYFLSFVWSDAQNNIYAITTLPSMHIGWSLVVTVTTIRWTSKAALFMVPWFFSVTLSTVYTLQHYAIDLIAGAIMGVVAIYIIDVLMRNETNEYEKHYHLAHGIQQSVQRLVQYIKKS